MSWVFEDPRKVLARHGFAPKRSYSQNFLISERAVRAIVQACCLGPDTRVLELGAGCGTLTHALAAASGHIIALERDPDMLAILAAECDPTRVEVLAADAKAVDVAQLAAAGRLVVAGNLPYAITGAIMRNLMQYSEALERAVLMVQREVRDRLVADAGTSAYGALSVFTGQLFAIESIIHLPSGAFYPPPRVSSSVVRLTPLAVPRAPRTRTFDRIVRAAFQARRKTLRNALAQAFGSVESDRRLGAAQIDGKRRGETLSIEEFGGLAAAFEGTPVAPNLDPASD
jgi:16S rRNA (adenine1518-N6/adenine1519-N6)-dimethyltransferase